MRSHVHGAGLIAQNQSSLAPFRLHRPTSLAEAAALVADDPEAVVAAGCTDLMAQLREGRVPRSMVHLGRVPELGQIEHGDGRLHIGATVTHHQGATSPAVARAVPGLERAWGAIATVRIRYSATIGGNVLARRFRYEMPVMLDALGARLEYAGLPPRPTSRLWAGSVTDGEGSGAWAPQGLLTGITIPTTDLVWFGYERSMRPTITVAAAMRRDGAGGLVVRAVAGSEYRRPYALVCRTPARFDASGIAEDLAAQVPAEAADYSGSAEYRRHLARVLITRMLRIAPALAGAR